MDTKYDIIVAGGTGSRMASAIPKQFLLLKGLPVLMHSLLAFRKSKSFPHLVLVLHPTMHEEWQSLCKIHEFNIPHTLVAGGNSRYESVKNGLNKIQSMDSKSAQALIAVHDAVRPLVPPSLIDHTYTVAQQSRAAALAIASSNSIRLQHLSDTSNSAYPREKVFLMQTPQTFTGTVLFKAYEQAEDESCTDDASIVEKTGIPITLVPGDTCNIKITFPEDLPIAEKLLDNLESSRTADDSQ